MPGSVEDIYAILSKLLTKERILELHRLIPDFGLDEPREVNDENKLMMMVIDVEHLISKRSDPIEIAAYVIKSIITPLQMFRSGNHRTASLLLKLIYKAAGLELTIDEEEYLTFMDGVPNWAESYIIHWLKEHTQKS